MLKKLQAASGLVFFAFVTVHLANTALAALGPAAYDGLQRALRAVYQLAPIEALLLAAAAVHAVTGVMRIVSEPKRELTRRARWHRYAGFFLLAVIVGHVLAVRGASWFFDVYPGFAGLAFSIDYLPGVFYPYYFLLGLAGFYHGVNGASIAARRLGARFTLGGRALAAVTGVYAVALALALLGLGGVLFDIGNPADSDFAALALELIGAAAP